MSANDVAIIDCNCSHDYQDRRYGKGKRVHNPTLGKNGQWHRCTVCGSGKGKQDNKKSK